MNYKSITALGLVLSLLVGVNLADAANKKTSTISKKQLERLLKKSKDNKNAPTMVVKGGSRGGVQVVTEAPAQNKIESSAAPKSTQQSSAPKDSKQEKQKEAQPKANAKAKPNSMLVEKDGKSYFLGVELPADYQKIGIYGESELTKKQAVAYIKQTNPKVRLDCSVEELADLY